MYDGRLANVGWLQELPKPVTNLSWDNAAIVSGATLTKLGLEEDDIVEISVGSGKVKAPVIVAPGHPDNSITVHLGYGRQVGRVAGGAGFNAYLIRPSYAPFVATGSVKKVDGKWGVAITKSHYQDHRGKAAGGDHVGVNHSLEGNEAEERGIIRYATLDEYKRNPGFANEGEGHEKTNMGTSLFPNWEYKENAWGMSIDMNSCTGCNACIVSCYAENNIAVVGKQQVRIGPQHAVAAHRHVLRRRPGGSEGALPADDVPALRERSMRAGLPGGRDGAYAGRPEHDGLQPLRGHSLLLEQLPVQGAAFQLPALLRL